MSDLISRKALLEALRESHEHHASNSREKVLLMRDLAIVNEQPTAYDPDKIVEQLEGHKIKGLDKSNPTSMWMNTGLLPLAILLAIVVIPCELASKLKEKM